MALTWVLLFALTLPVNTVTSQPCRRLFMQGLDNTHLLPFAELSGLYTLTNITNDGFSEYRHETHPNQSFFYNITLRALVLGKGLLLAQTSGRPPTTNVPYPYSGVITAWHLSQPTTKSYKSVSSDYIQPRCVDADPEFLRCDSGQLTFSTALTFHTDDGQSINITQYEQVDGQYTDYRPIYKASVPRGSSTNVYLYHVDGSWRLGNDYTRSTSAFGRVSDSALRPEFITGEWQIRYNGVWQNWTGTLRCRGITTANLCRDVRCQNGGTCISAGSQIVQCSCQRGYRGPYCQNRVPSCQHFGNWTAGDIVFYYTEDSYEGSLTAWFCARGERPEFGYSVCENRSHHPSWSNHPKCMSDATPWPYRVGPAVAVILFMHLWTAPWIYACLVHRRIRRTKTDEKENKAIAAIYKTELEKLENRTPKPPNDVMIRELYEIQQQLKDEFDQLLSRRRQRDRKGTKTLKFCRVYSFSVCISFLLAMIYLGAKFGLYPTSFEGIDIFNIILLIILAITFLVESRFSSELQYIANLSTLTSATERIQSFRNAKPTMNMNAECSHQDGTREDVSAHIVEPFQFTHWFDSSQRTLTDIHRSRATRIKMKLSVQFGDEATAQYFAETFQQFQDENRNRDDYVRFFISNEVDGFQKRLAVHDDSGKPPWISSVWFWLATLFGLGWPYRITFNLATSKTKYSIEKVIFSPAPPPSSNFISESPEIDSIKRNIQGMLDRLNVNALSVYDGEMPVRCVAANEHMNVPL